VRARITEHRDDGVGDVVLRDHRGPAVAGGALPVKPVETSGGLIYPCGLL